MAYKITPYSNDDDAKISARAVEVDNKPTLEERLSRIEDLLTNPPKTGGKFDGLL